MMDQNGIDAYFDQNENFRTKMVNALFPGITNAYGTVKYILRGMKNDPDFQLVIHNWIGRPPATIIELPAMAQSVKHNENAGAMEFQPAPVTVTKTLPQPTYPPQPNNQSTV